MANVESVDQNQAYNISAALTYTAQLINVMAFYLGIKLPIKLCYRLVVCFVICLTNAQSLVCLVVGLLETGMSLVGNNLHLLGLAT